MITWANPQAFWALLVIPIGIGLYIFWIRKNYPKLYFSSNRSWIKHRYLFGIHTPFVLEVLATIALIVVLARPQNSQKWEEGMIEGIDLVLAIDASSSMEAVDLAPNRFEASKQVASSLISQRPNDNIGLVVFAGEGFTQCPITMDHTILLNRLNELHPEMVDDGTAIGIGLATAINALRSGQGKSKIVILITDGSNNVGDITPSMSAQMAKALGIRVYTIGVGTHGKARVPVQTSIGVRYVEQEVTIDEGMLTHIAELSGGKYYRATNNKELESIYQEIDSLEKTKLTTKNFTAYEEKYRLFGVLALALLALALVLRTTLFRPFI